VGFPTAPACGDSIHSLNASGCGLRAHTSIIGLSWVLSRKRDCAGPCAFRDKWTGPVLILPRSDVERPKLGRPQS
jgi:hypothetical protein